MSSLRLRLLVVAAAPVGVSLAETAATERPSPTAASSPPAPRPTD
ncbi:hypothetical protein [Streptomyces sp. NPDC007020]